MVEGVGGVLSNVGAEEYQFATSSLQILDRSRMHLLRLTSCDTLRAAAQGIREQELIRATLPCVGVTRFTDEGKKS